MKKARTLQVSARDTLSTGRASSDRELKVKDTKMTKEVMEILGDSPFAALYHDLMHGRCYFMGYFWWQH